MPDAMKFSRLIAGCMTWGIWGKDMNPVQATAYLAELVEIGVHTFDHADIYGDYTTETLFGQALVQSGVKRESIQLISKCGIQIAKTRDNRVKHYQYDRKYIVESAHRSLRELRSDYLDLFLLHRPSPLMEAEEVAEAVHELKDTGKVLHFGVSNFSPSQIALLETAVKVEANQFEFSLSQTEPFYNGVLDDCQSSGRLPMAWSPLGAMLKKSREDREERIWKAMQPLQSKYGTDEAGLAIMWLKRHPAGVLPVVGTTQLERMRSMFKASGSAMESQDWFALWEAHIGRRVP